MRHKLCDAENYRPLSLTSVVCKVMKSNGIYHEGLHTNGIETNLEADKISTRLHEGKILSDYLLETVEARTRTVGCMSWHRCYKKAFDTVPHKRLLSNCKPWVFMKVYGNGLKHSLIIGKSANALVNSY